MSSPSARRRPSGLAISAIALAVVAASSSAAQASEHYATNAAGTVTAAVSRLSITSLAAANIGGMACAPNSLGGTGYASSCTGNGGQPEYWCADFAEWVWSNAGVQNTAGLTPAAHSFYSYGVTNGLLSSTPALGDVVVFSNTAGDTTTDSGGIHHVAIVSAVNADGTIQTISGDWGGQSGTEAHFAGTSHVVANPAYNGAVGSYSSVMGMWIEGYITPPGATSGHGASLAGDGLADIVAVHSDGTAQAWRNVAGFAPTPWGGDSVTIGTGLADPTRVRFADLDGDGKTDLVYVEPDGSVRAWHNVAGFAAMPWGGDSVVIGTGFTGDPLEVQFADLDGDGKADLVFDHSDGTVQAWHNAAGFAAMPWGGDSVTIATGMTNAAALHFADLDADGKADLVYDQPDGTVQAWHNAAGFAAMPWGGDSVTIATGMTDAAALRFADLDGDGKSDLVYDHSDGTVQAWHNVAGFAAMPWGGDSVTIATGFTEHESLQFA